MTPAQRIATVFVGLMVAVSFVVGLPAVYLFRLRWVALFFAFAGNWLAGISALVGVLAVLRHGHFGLAAVALGCAFAFALWRGAAVQIIQTEEFQRWLLRR